MLKLNKNSGFTLIELTVVIVLISIMLFFTMPKFQSFVGPNQNRKFSRWLTMQINTLKDNAARNRKLYILHISPVSGKLWITEESATEEAILEAEEGGHQVPEDLRITDVEFPVHGKISAGRADICFYRNGYSDKALIHLEDDDNNQISFLIEPFLSKVKQYDEYVEFED